MFFGWLTLLSGATRLSLTSGATRLSLTSGAIRLVRGATRWMRSYGLRGAARMLALTPRNWEPIYTPLLYQLDFLGLFHCFLNQAGMF